MKRIITYDVREGNNYDKLYTFIKKYNGKKITESTYEIDSILQLDEFKRQLKASVNSNDSVYYISVNRDNILFYNKI